jgi:hypothetical protein
VYCVSRFCGPTTDALQQLAKTGPSSADYPRGVWKDYQSSTVNKAAGQWLLRDGSITEPWLFLIGPDGDRGSVGSRYSIPRRSSRARQGRRVSGTPHGDHDHDHFGPADACHAGLARGNARDLDLVTGLMALYRRAPARRGRDLRIGRCLRTRSTFTDALTAIPLLIAFRLARRPPTRRYPYGYHRAEDVAGLTIVALSGVSALLAAAEAIRRLVHPQPIEAAGWVLAAGALGFLGNEAVAQYRIRVGKRIGSAALVADGMHARTDGLRHWGSWRPRSAC